MGHFFSLQPKWFTMYLEHSEFSRTKVYFYIESIQNMAVLLQKGQISLLMAAQFGH